MGIFFMLMASASFATMAALVKSLGPEIGLVQMVCLRCLLAAPVLFVVLAARGKPLVVRAKKVLVWRTVLGMSAMFGFFYALTHMELAGCVFIGRVQPLLLALLAPVVLGEKTPAAAWGAIGCGLAGVMLILNPSGVWTPAAGVALFSALASAGAHLMVRRLNRTDEPLVIVANFTLATGLLTLVPAMLTYRPMNGRQWLTLAAIAVLASLGQILMTNAYRRDRAPAVAAASYSSLVLSVAYGYFFWNEVPQPMVWLGGLLIFSGGIGLLRSRIGKEERAVAAGGKQ